MGQRHGEDAMDPLEFAEESRRHAKEKEPEARDEHKEKVMDERAEDERAMAALRAAPDEVRMAQRARVLEILERDRARIVERRQKLGNPAQLAAGDRLFHEAARKALIRREVAVEWYRAQPTAPEPEGIWQDGRE